MLALTVHQPWAWAIVHGVKRYENRSWRTEHRGPIVIHAGRSAASLGREGDLIPGLPPYDELPFGAIVGLVRLIDIRRPSECEGDPFAVGPWCWVLADARAFEPIHWRGGQMLFNVPDKLIDAHVRLDLGADVFKRRRDS